MLVRIGGVKSNDVTLTIPGIRQRTLRAICCRIKWLVNSSVRFIHERLSIRGIMLETVQFYLIPWSHFCEKIRWALDLKEIPYEKISFNVMGPTPGLERAPASLMKLTPIIEDPNNKDEQPFFISDSTPILQYLDARYPQGVTLFPANERQAVLDMCIRLDSELGPSVRRLIYVQILGERPRLLSMLDGPNHAWAYNPDDLRSRLVARFVACFIIARFRLHRLREDRVREKTEELLLTICDRLKNHNFLVGEQFTAADLTFCSLFRPVWLIPYFKDDERFHLAFDYYTRIRNEYDLKCDDNPNMAQVFVNEYRAQKKKRPTATKIKAFVKRVNVINRCCSSVMSKIVSKVYGPSTDQEQATEFSSKDKVATNDHRNVDIQSTFGKASFFVKYQMHRIFTIPHQVAYLNGET